MDLSRFSAVNIGSKTINYDVEGVTVLIWQPYACVRVDEAAYVSRGMGFKSGGPNEAGTFPAAPNSWWWPRLTCWKHSGLTTPYRT